MIMIIIIMIIITYIYIYIHRERDIHNMLSISIMSISISVTSIMLIHTHIYQSTRRMLICSGATARTARSGRSRTGARSPNLSFASGQLRPVSSLRRRVVELHTLHFPRCACHPRLNYYHYHHYYYYHY